MPKHIYLNGPSSAGKTILAKALQDALETPYLHVCIDQIIDWMPQKLNNWTGGYAPLGFSWKELPKIEGMPAYELRMGPFAEQFSRTFRALVSLLSKEGYHLILEDVALGGCHDVYAWKRIFQDPQALYVGVIAPLHIIEQREKSRGDRWVGSARAQYFKVHHHVAYDLEIDTYAYSIDENVKTIKQALLH
jgi:chloramphenicol 3-O phosphotransferase